MYCSKSWRSRQELSNEYLLCKFCTEETRQAIARGQRGKGRGPDDTENEHLQALDDDGQQLVHHAFSEIYESGQEPEEWQKRCHSSAKAEHERPLRTARAPSHLLA